MNTPTAERIEQLLAAVRHNSGTVEGKQAVLDLAEAMMRHRVGRAASTPHTQPERITCAEWLVRPPQARHRHAIAVAVAEVLGVAVLVVDPAEHARVSGIKNNRIWRLMAYGPSEDRENARRLAAAMLDQLDAELAVLANADSRPATASRRATFATKWCQYMREQLRATLAVVNRDSEHEAVVACRQDATRASQALTTDHPSADVLAVCLPLDADSPVLLNTSVASRADSKSEPLTIRRGLHRSAHRLRFDMLVALANATAGALNFVEHNRSSSSYTVRLPDGQLLQLDKREVEAFVAGAWAASLLPAKARQQVSQQVLDWRQEP